jgi:hypothetical protein
VAVAEIPADQPDCDDAKSTRLVVSTDEEIEGFHIIRAIVCSEAAVSRVAAHDIQTYFGARHDDTTASRSPVRGPTAARSTSTSSMKTRRSHA